MTDTAFYYALSTIAQCAAALIGFLGLWRLDRLRDEDTQMEQTLRGLIILITSKPPLRMTKEFVLERCRRIVTTPQPEPEEQSKPQIEPRLTRWEALPGKQRWLMYVLSKRWIEAFMQEADAAGVPIMTIVNRAFRQYLDLREGSCDRTSFEPPERKKDRL